MAMTFPSSNRQRFVVYSSLFSFFIFLCILASINEIRFDNFHKFRQCAFTQTVENNSTSENVFLQNSSSDSNSSDIRILMGILTLPDHYHKRHFLRMIYGTQSFSGAKIDVKFVFCNLTKEDQKMLVAMEIMQYDDIIILNCKENMDNGKTYTYFSSLPEIFNASESDSSSPSSPPYHYVMKVDDDTYFRLQNLVDSLIPLSREDFYYGFPIPCNSRDPFVNYMSGMGYLVSWDIAEWIRESPIPKDNLIGPEDLLFGGWLRDGRRAKNRYSAKWAMYDLPEPRTACAHPLWPNTVAVHRLKNQDKWIRTLNYFNVTKALKPSKLYHIGSESF